jgi:hypothetical protein
MIKVFFPQISEMNDFEIKIGLNRTPFNRSYFKVVPNGKRLYVVPYKTA